MGYTGLLLHTYNVFTEREPVAKVKISEQKQDEKGKYADVEITVYKFERTALTRLFGVESNKSILGDVQRFRLYGDTIYLGGPIVKFRDELMLFNFKTMFKLGKVYARYDLDNNLENIRRPDQVSSYDINGGFAEWKAFFDHYQKPGILGDLFRLLVDSTQLSMAGQMIGNRSIQYTLFISDSGFIWKID